MLFAMVVFSTGCDQAAVLPDTATGPTSSMGNGELSAYPTAQELVDQAIQKRERGETLNLDEEFVALSRELPGFAGFYVDEQGRFTVRLETGHSLRETQVQTALASMLAPASELLRTADASIVIQESDYSFADLYAWKLQAHALLSVAGVTGLDADEVRNRVRIIVEDEAAAGRVREALQRLSIPSDAVVIETGRGVREAVDLTDHWYLVEGGFEISAPGGWCTLGFSAYLNGQLGFITNSHCTSTYGGVDGILVYQDANSKARKYIGYETVDPPFYYYGSRPTSEAGIRGPVDDGKLHRKSDAAFIQSVTSDVNIPYIARTQYRNTSIGSKTRSGGFRINGEASLHVAGTEINKIGRTTGWTYGNISSTCEMIESPSGGNRWLDCQYRVDGGVNEGDSGSPAFSWSGSGDNITLHGVVWGCTTAYPGGPCIQEFIYSPIQGIEQDLGLLTTH